jgi:hypothetical protein
VDGWIKLHRKIQDHWIYQEKRKFSRYEAWLDMMMMANHKDNKFLLGNELVEVKKGQFITSEIKLMGRWDWGKNKLRLFFDLLVKDGMIIKKSDRKRTTITICNYSIYHDSENNNGLQTDYERTIGRPSADTNKNDKNDKNDKEKDIYSPEFESFWNEYPRKLGKKEAYKTWNTVIKKGELPQAIIQCAINYKNQCEDCKTETRFIKHPKTFLNEERYKDYTNGGEGIEKLTEHAQELRHRGNQAKSEFDFLDSTNRTGTRTN